MRTVADAPLARVLRPAHRPADRRRDVAGAGGLVDPAGGASSSSWRPQEAFGPQVFDQIVRNINANRTSEVRARGKRAKLGFVITTGDLADNQQFNETTWFKTVLDGGHGRPVLRQADQRHQPVPGRDGGDVAALNAAVAARLYTGVADYDDYAGVPADRYGGFWDPDDGAAGARTPRSRATRACSSARRTRSRPRA